MGRESGRLDPGDLLDALEKSAQQSEWSPLFTDDFQRTSVGDDWKIVKGQARITNGWMRLEASLAGDVYAVVRRPFPDNVRVEFDARFPKGLSYVGDLGCFVAGDEESCDHVGYCLSFAADGNTCSRIQRGGVDIRIDPKAVAAVGVGHREGARARGARVGQHADVGELRPVPEGDQAKAVVADSGQGY
ncbi:MAG: hypothetical protein ACYTGB_20205, partial [Planctomycetota bacterium]